MTTQHAPSIAVPDQDSLAEVVGELRAARRRRRLGDTDWFELAYRVYTTAFVVLVVTIMLSGWVGNSAVPVEAVDRFAADGPAWAGLGFAVLVVVAVRSGTRGGPLSVEAADLQHILMSPARRSATLRRPSIEVLGYGILAGTVVAAVGGSFISQRVPGGSAEWVSAGALFGAVSLSFALGSALFASSRTAPPVLLTGLSWLLLLWAVADVAHTGPTAPTTYEGTLLFLPVAHLVPGESWAGIPWVLASVVVPVVAVALVGGLSIEAARRRTELVSQLRFAVTVQDLRTVILLRRQLAAEVPRTRPWFRVPRLLDRVWPVTARDLRSVAHWPPVRIARVMVLCLAAGLAVRGMWSGTVPLLVVAGVATFVAALDATEPLSQDVDHPHLLESLPVDPGRILVRHLAQPVIVMVLAGAVTLAVVWALDPAPEVWSVGLVLLATAPAAAVAGAAVSIVSSIGGGAADQLMTPEVAGPRLVFRTVWPPLVAMIGFLPAFVASRATGPGDPRDVAAGVAVPVLVLVVAVFGWVRLRESIHGAMAEQTGTGNTGEGR
jgi:hypothetical protein